MISKFDALCATRVQGFISMDRAPLESDIRHPNPHPDDPKKDSMLGIGCIWLNTKRSGIEEPVYILMSIIDGKAKWDPIATSFSANECSP